MMICYNILISDNFSLTENNPMAMPDCSIQIKKFQVEF